MKTGYKRLFLFVVTLLTTLCADAQHKGYEVGYDRAHYFYQMGDELSIIDMDMEWPRRLDGAQVEPLCRYMMKELFGEEDVSLKAATDKYLKRFGQPVNQAFGTMPDDSKYCHVAIGSKLIGYESGRYVSFQLTLMQQPEPASSQQPRQMSKLLTYDLASGRVMAIDEMLRLRRINDVFYRDHFVLCIASGALIKEEPDNVDVSNWPLDVCYADGYMVFDLGFKETNQLHNSIAMVSCEKMDFYLDTKFKKWLKTAFAPKAEEDGSLGFSESISEQENGLSDEACVIFTDTMPQFVHLPLLLKPDGKGKLSKRDGDRLGFPVFPLEWHDPKSGDISSGYRERGYLPQAVVNFLALLGWNPGDDREMFSMDELIKEFSFEHCSKKGAKFDFEKGKWFNHEYLMNMDDTELAQVFKPVLAQHVDPSQFSDQYIAQAVGLVKSRVNFVGELWDQARFFFVRPEEYAEKDIRKRWKPETPDIMRALIEVLRGIDDFTSQNSEEIVLNWIKEHEYHLGNVMNAFRLTVVGECKGPHMFDISQLLGKEETIARIEAGIENIRLIEN